MVQVMHNNCCKNVKEPVFHVEQKEHTPLKRGIQPYFTAIP